MPVVKMPDGQLVDMPDQLTPDQAAQLESLHKPASPLESFGRDLVGGFGQAAALAPRAAQMLTGHVGKADEGLPPEQSGTVTNPRTNNMSRFFGDMADSTEQYWKEVQNKSTNPWPVQAITRGVGGAAAAPVGGVPALAAGGGAGLATEIAQKVSPNNPVLATGAGLVGGVLAGSAAGWAGSARPQSANLAREAMEGISPEQLQTAGAFQAKMRAQGHDIDLAQALSATSETGGGNLTTIRNTLANSAHGMKTQAVLREQPTAIAREAEMAVAGLPGKNINPEANANLVQQTATEVLEKIKQDRSATWKRVLDKSIEEQRKLGQGRVDQAVMEATKTVKDLVAVHPQVTKVTQSLEQALAVAKRAGLPTDQFERQLVAAQKVLKEVEGRHQVAVQAIAKAKEGAKAVDVIPPDVLAATAKKLDDIIVSHPPGSVEAKELKRLAKNLRNGEDMLNSPEQINQIFKQFTTRLKSPDLKTAGVDAGVAKYLGKTVGELREQLADGFVPMRKANQAFVDFTKTRVDTLRQGPVGTLAQPHGYDPATQAMVSKFEGMMSKGVDPTAKVSNVRTVAKQLATVNPKAFENGFKGWLSGKVQKALTSGTEELPITSDAQVIPRLYDNLFKDKLQWQGIKDATEQMAVIRGENPAEMIRGLENLHSLTRAAKNSPGAVSGLSPADLKRIGGGSATANLVRVASFLPMNKAGEAIERTVLGNTLKQFDTILTSPEGAKMLIELGKAPVMSRKAQVILGTFAGSYANADGLPANNPPMN